MLLQFLFLSKLKLMQSVVTLHSVSSSLHFSTPSLLHPSSLHLFISPPLHLSIPLSLHSFTPPPLPQLPPQPVQSRPQHTAKHPVHSLDDCQQRHFPYCGDDGDTKCCGEGTCVCVCGCEGGIVRGNSLTVAAWYSW